MDSSWLILDKSPGITSSQVTRKVGRLFGMKAGHGGTLDSFACGLLPIGMNKACKCLGYILESDKEYIFTALWGMKLDTLDITGRCKSYSAKIPTEEEILEVIPEFIGTLQQIPPVFSAIKKDGVAYYKRALRQECVSPPPRQVKVHSLELLQHDNNQGVSQFSVACSKGFYVRALARDLGERLGTFGCVSYLRRIKAGPFHVKDAVLMENLTPQTELLPLDYPFKKMNRIVVNSTQAAKLQNGMDIAHEGTQDSFAIYSGDSMIGFGVRKGSRVFPRRILIDGSANGKC